MIKLRRGLFRPDEKLTIAVSGGVDSLAALHYLAKRHRNLEMLYLDHSDEAAEAELPVVQFYSELLELPLRIQGGFDRKRFSSSSLECAWRDFRYEVFFRQQNKVITCHHLDDCVESFIFFGTHGKPSIIRPSVQNVVRPFLLTRKSGFVAYANFWGLFWAEDPMNTNETASKRVFIRKTVRPLLEEINPGLETVVRKRVEAAYNGMDL